ncbi:MAG: outer membrane beta-barrel protein [Ignavibacteriaceae bacterium]|nr:outer membrane beta-barrel protein [Ignavibacteriaceae bacterium]
MRKNIIFIVAFLIISNISYGQMIPKVGLKFGLNISNSIWYFNEPLNAELEWENYSSYTLRGFVEINLTDNFGIEGELGFSRKGVYKEVPISPIDQPDVTIGISKTKNITEYLSLAALAKYNIYKGFMSPYILAGPQINFLVNYNVRNGSERAYDEFNTAIFGYSVGSGIEINVKPIDILIEYRFERDLTNSNTTEEFDVHNYSHSIMAGLRYSIY